jgi:redox-sensitive bicupin YhaK (pirin superfamily)
MRIVAGEVGGVRGPVEGIVTEPTMLDVAIAPKGRLRAPLPDGHNALLQARRRGVRWRLK